MTVVIFAPFARIKKHAALERYIAEELTAVGGDVLLVTCATDLSQRCTAMESVNLDAEATDEQKLEVCRKCIRIQSGFESRSHYSSISLSDLLVHPFDRLAREIHESFCRSPGPDFHWESHPLGRIWAYETILRFKSEAATHAEGRNHYRDFAGSGARAYAAAKSLLGRLEARPEALLVHSIEYGINRSFCLPFMEEGIPCFNFANAGQMSDFAPGFRVSRATDGGRIDDVSLLRRQNEASLQPLAAGEGDAVIQWFADRIGQKGAHAYSKPRSSLGSDRIREQLGADARKSVLVLTSSPDETTAGRFSDIADSGGSTDTGNGPYRFVNLVVAAAHAAPDLQFVIRLHPRLAPNHRDSVESPHLSVLLQSLRSAPDNVIVNDPSQGLSLYDVAMIADSALNWSSTAGTELLGLGIPVIGILGARGTEVVDRSIEVVPEDVDEVLRALRERTGTPLSTTERSAVYRHIVAAVSRTVIPIHAASKSPIDWGEHPPTTLKRKFMWGQPRRRSTPTMPRRRLTAESPRRGATELISDWTTYRSEALGDVSQEKREIARIEEWLSARLHPWDGEEGVVSEALRRHKR